MTRRPRPRPSFPCFLLALIVFAVVGCEREGPAPERLPVPKLPSGPVMLRVAYVDNPRFGSLDPSEIQYVLQVAAQATLESFGREVRFEPLQTLGVDALFAALPPQVPNREQIPDFAHGRIDRGRLREGFVENLRRDREDLDAMIEYATPFLVEPVRERTYESLADALMGTQLARLRRLSTERAQDGRPLLDATLYSEFSAWDSLHAARTPFEVVVTNQLIASMEYYSNSVHSALRGGVTNGLTTPNLSSRLQATSVVSVQPMVGEAPTLRELRGGESYARRNALRYAGLVLAHEMGHLLFHLAHPYGRTACIMNPTPLLRFRAWADALAPSDCPLEASGPMSPGAATLYKPAPL